MQKQKPITKKRKRNITKINQIILVTGIDDINEIERLLEKSDRQKRIEKRKLKKIKKKQYKPKKILRDQPLPQPQVIQYNSQPQQISIDANIILPFIKLLLDKNLVTSEELQTLTLKNNNPLKQVDFKLEGEVLDRSQLRQYWLYLMKHNELFCALCGHPITEKTNKGPWRLTAEHTIPRSEGGSSDSTNLVPAHEICNNIKTNIMPEEWERVGLEMLRSYGIHVDTKHSMYKYHKEIQR